MRFEHPQLLWAAAVAVPALAAFFYWSWRVKQKLILQFVNARLLPSLAVGVSAGRDKARMGLLIVALAGILLALARPQWGFDWEEAHLKGLDIIVALDTSRSMLAQDVSPDRMERAKLAAIDLMRRAKSDRLGLVVFAGNAFLQSPLTLDDQAFQQSINAVKVGIVPEGGTSLSSAIRTSLASFEKGNDNHKVMVLFTDGEDHDADADTLAATKEAADAGMRIFTIGVGTPEGELLRVPDEQGNIGFVKDEDGNVVKSKLNQLLLEKIATDSKGFYLPLKGADPMETLYAKGLAPLPTTTETTRRTQVYREQYKWFLGFSLLCLIFEALLPERPRSSRRTRSTGAQPAPATAAVTALVLLLLAPASGLASPASAYNAYQSGDFKDSLQEYNRLAETKTNDYRLRYDAGAAAYKAKDLEAAQKQFNAALDTPSIIADPQNQQRTYYNLGNTLFRMGEPESDADKKKELWQHAVENYNLALHLNTNDTDAKNNLAYVKQQLEELKKQQEQQNKDQKDQKDQKKDQQQQQQKQQQQQQQQKKDQKDQKDQQDQQNQQQQQQQQQKDQKSEQQKQDEQKARQEQAKKDQEKKQQQAQASQGDKKDNQDQSPEQAGEAQQQMTPEEAKKLLEATKDDAKILPIKPENQQDQSPPKKIKDW